MARLIDVEVETSRIRINFPYDREIVDLVRTLPDRTYDNRSKSWFVPLKHLSYVLQRLERFHFKYSPQLRVFRDKHREEGALPQERPRVPPGTVTISQLNLAARKALQARFQKDFWLIGELQDFNKNVQSSYRTYFFDLLERPLPGASEVARVKAVLFESDREQIGRVLAQSGIELQDGVSIRARVNVDLYPRQGSFQVILKEIDPAYTAGELELNRERIVQALEARGIARRNQRRTLPECPLRVGLITSYESDAYNDFIHQLAKSGFGFEVTTHHANVQGTNTERSVLKALEYFRERAGEFDVLVVIRGGGSRSDLAYFDTQKIGEAVCLHPLKVVCGIGHQRDVSLLDLIAESTKTPTAAASILIDRVERYLGGMEETYRSIVGAVQEQTMRAANQLFRAGARLERGVVVRHQRAEQRQNLLRRRLMQQIELRVHRERRQVAHLEGDLERSVERSLGARRLEVQKAQGGLSLRSLWREMNQMRGSLKFLEGRLQRSANQRLREERQEVKRLDDALHHLDPQRVLERGFAMVRRSGETIASAASLQTGSEFDVIFADGAVRARALKSDEDRADNEQGKHRHNRNDTIEEPHE